jgi:hypothetical protein
MTDLARLPVAFRWGSLPSEWRESFPCDPLLPVADHVLHRGIDVAAPAPLVFRWVCQLKVAPYSYDWLDNFGRSSPRRLTPGAERLTVGEQVMTIFELATFEPDRHLTLRLAHRRAVALFGEIAITYRVGAAGPSRSRLAVRMRVRYPPGRYGAVVRRLFPYGDAFMMRRQLFTLRTLAERQAQAEAT